MIVKFKEAREPRENTLVTGVDLLPCSTIQVTIEILDSVRLEYD